MQLQARWPFAVVMQCVMYLLSCLGGGLAEVAMENILMGIHNSLTDFYVGLWSALYSDVGGSASIPLVERERDVATLRRRVACEGFGFLTKILPSLGKAIDLALATGVRLQFHGFKKRHGTQLPSFLGTLISRIFDDEGSERCEASAADLKRLRQLCFIFYKLELPYNDQDIKNVLDLFETTDRDLAFNYADLTPVGAQIADCARALLRRITFGLDLVDIVPKHGPGVVSTGERQWQKSAFPRLIEKLEAKYPYSEYFVFNKTHLVDVLPKLAALTTIPHGSAKVVLVPKDSRGPRLISCEPVENQWIQQGQMEKFIHLLESHPYTKGRINFRSQDVNRRLALEGSTTGEWVTLDMKEASDRVSNGLVEFLFHEHLNSYIQASRSNSTVLPDGREILLKKFAPMGSALCFPVEALIFWVLSVAVVHVTLGVPLARARERIFVYGDDIICDRGYHAVIRLHLPEFDLKFNEGKCCTAGSFRESCGVDAYKGTMVTPLRVKCVWSRRRLSANELESYVAYSNWLHATEHYEAAQYIEDAVLRKGHKIPYATLPNSGALVWLRPGYHVTKLNDQLGIRRRINTRFQRQEGRLPFSVGRTFVPADLDGWAEMLSRRTDDVPVYLDHCPRRFEGARTLEDCLRSVQNALFDDSVRNKTVKIQLNPTPASRAGCYAVRYRNRIVYRWTPLWLYS